MHTTCVKWLSVLYELPYWQVRHALQSMGEVLVHDVGFDIQSNVRSDVYGIVSQNTLPYLAAIVFL